MVLSYPKLKPLVRAGCGPLLVGSPLYMVLSPAQQHHKEEDSRCRGLVSDQPDSLGYCFNKGLIILPFGLLSRFYCSPQCNRRVTAGRNAVAS
jgi:hypothetical protein